MTAARALTAPALSEWLRARGIPAYRSRQVLRWVYRRGALGWPEMSDIPRELREALASEFEFPYLSPSLISRAADGTRKFLFPLDAGLAVEAVLIPDGRRLTACVSSQAGCGMGCSFCATARLGFQRNLTAAEIVGQLLSVRRGLEPGEEISNIVFMGMGEPLHNYNAVVEAVEVLTAEWGLGFSSRRITVSTVGLVREMERCVRDTAVNIAVSLSATTNAARDRLMPVNRKYSLEELLGACRRLPIPQRRRITFEYVMLHNVNDSPADARRLVRLLHGIRAKVNLIPFNGFPGSGFRSSPPERIRAFQERLLGSGVHASVRTSRGEDIQAACGQLAAARAA